MPNRNFRAKNPVFSKNFRAEVKDSRDSSPIVYMTGNANAAGHNAPPGDFFRKWLKNSQRGVIVLQSTISSRKPEKSTTASGGGFRKMLHFND